MSGNITPASATSHSSWVRMLQQNTDEAVREIQSCAREGLDLRQYSTAGKVGTLHEYLNRVNRATAQVEAITELLKTNSSQIPGYQDAMGKLKGPIRESIRIAHVRMRDEVREDRDTVTRHSVVLLRAQIYKMQYLLQKSPAPTFEEWQRETNDLLGCLDNLQFQSRPLHLLFLQNVRYDDFLPFVQYQPPSVFASAATFLHLTPPPTLPNNPINEASLDLILTCIDLGVDKGEILLYPDVADSKNEWIQQALIRYKQIQELGETLATTATAVPLRTTATAADAAFASPFPLSSDLAATISAFSASSQPTQQPSAIPQPLQPVVVPPSSLLGNPTAAMPDSQHAAQSSTTLITPDPTSPAAADPVISSQEVEALRMKILAKVSERDRLRAERADIEGLKTAISSIRGKCDELEAQFRATEEEHHHAIQKQFIQPFNALYTDLSRDLSIYGHRLYQNAQGEIDGARAALLQQFVAEDMPQDERVIPTETFVHAALQHELFETFEIEAMVRDAFSKPLLDKDKQKIRAQERVAKMKGWPPSIEGLRTRGREFPDKETLRFMRWVNKVETNLTIRLPLNREKLEEDPLFYQCLKQVWAMNQLSHGLTTDMRPEIHRAASGEPADSTWMQDARGRNLQGTRVGVVFMPAFSCIDESGTQGVAMKATIFAV